MAVSNATGAQILNINIGLGLPWLIVALAGKPVVLKDVKSILTMACFQAWNVMVYFSLVLFPILGKWLSGSLTKASLDPRKGKMLVGAYFVTATAFILYNRLLA